MDELTEYRERAFAMHPAFRVGIVQQQDTARAKVRVVFPDYDEVTSWWLPVLFAKTQNDKVYWIPDVGEQVVCLMDLRDEAGAVLGAIYSMADGTPVDSADKLHLGFKDNARFEYDRSSHVLDLKFQDTSEFKYDAGAHLLDLKLEDGAEFKYDAGGHLLDLKFQDGAEIKYDASAHALSCSLPSGGSFDLTASGAQIQIDASGNVNIRASGQVRLGSAQLAGVARLGDTVRVQDDEGGMLTGTIVTASIDVLAG
jgi:phage baseplate assembly protein gpV